MRRTHDTPKTSHISEMKQYFKVTNKEEYDDLMRTIERGLPEARWQHNGELPTSPNGNKWSYPTIISIEADLIKFPSVADANLWKIGQSLYEPTALEELISIAKNKDGSITISPELQVKLVVALRGGEK